METKTKIKFILAIDILVVILLSLLIKNLKMLLSFLFVMFVIWLFIDKKDINERLYENFLALSIGFIEGILIFLCIVYNRVFFIAKGALILTFLIILLVLFPRYNLLFEIFDEFVENLKQKSGFLTLLSFFGFLISLEVFLHIFWINNHKDILTDIFDFLTTLGLIMTVNLLILQFYTFKKFL
ncbi:conserved membrane protein of unknown function [Methanocaldococcus lauensis]|uniref:Uncharacterized protein n=1 Tax=Methanocaldococcus lauensis TaxID=2546128 RepID=A0A8D6PTW9_9EURY|nr:hypothetical protein [Methanocaldococcus lauensis]CAB3290198.1 conserved membrane protein of unknown function [Methanocaldococcus lauensis]